MPAHLLPADEDFKPSAAIVEVLINFLIRVALIAADGKDDQAHSLSAHCVALVSDGLASSHHTYLVELTGDGVICGSARRRFSDADMRRCAAA